MSCIFYSKNGSSAGVAVASIGFAFVNSVNKFYH